MSYTIVVIDDERVPAPLEGGTILLYRTLKDGLDALKEIHSSGGSIDELWLDHDLGPNDESEYSWDTSMPIVNWLEEIAVEGRPFPTGHVFVHTGNFAVVPQMMAALRPHYVTHRAELPIVKGDGQDAR